MINDLGRCRSAGYLCGCSGRFVAVYRHHSIRATIVGTHGGNAVVARDWVEDNCVLIVTAKT